MYVDVIVDICVSSLDRVFQYHVPDAFAADVAVGSQVQIPFGKSNRQMAGFVVGISDTPSFDPDKIKDILAADTNAVSVEGQLIALAEWIRVHNGATMAQALNTVMPVKRQIREKNNVVYRLADEEKAERLLESSKKDKRYKARVRLLEAILSQKELSKETVSGVLQIPPSTLKTVLASGAVTETVTRIYRNPVSDKISGWQGVTLNEEQARAVDEIWQAMHAPGEWQKSRMVHLLHGITGSGKTEVYMALMDRVLAEGRQVIVLIPEISLTLQTVSRFYEHFGDRIAVMNSRLSQGERYDQYMRAKRGDASIMIGPRSALFTPFDRLGLIIIDEEHENAYKSETTPRYHARDAAIARAEMAGAAVLLGSATPSVVTYAAAKEGQIGFHKLSRRAKEGSALPDVEIVDLRNEFRLKNRSILSRRLHEEIEKCLAAGEQMMLFINRRGYAGFVSCRSCGYVLKCDHCDVSMTSHNTGILKCHYCGHQMMMPKRCPSCGSPYIAAFGVGTEKVENMIRSEFPKARVLRMDKDTTSGREDMSKILKTFSEGGADILIGTQMIVKGHDFANVTLVGVLAADLSMFSGDYLSSERTFQLLTQAAGRAGRGSKGGHVIIQTYQPEHYCIKTAAAQDYEAFYNEEICFRKMMHYPPETQMLMVLAESKEEDKAGEAVKRLQMLMAEEDFRNAETLGPVPAGIAKVRDMYRYVLYIKHEDMDQLILIKDYLEGYIRWTDSMKNVYFNFDFNPAVLL